MVKVFDFFRISGKYRLVMQYNEQLFEKYDLLVPGKFDGGYLVIALYQKIKVKELDRYFSTGDIKRVLAELVDKFEASGVQSERIIKSLLHFYLKPVPDDPGRYYLTDFAEQVIELLLLRLDSPYKHYPLKQSFSQYFSIGSLEVANIHDLNRRFGREFVGPHKRIVTHHLEALEEELDESTQQLTQILDSKEKSATVIVKNFVSVFRKFGERAEDITNALADKDQFLFSLERLVDRFYGYMQAYKSIDFNEEEQELKRLKNDHSIAHAINEDLRDFFRTVDEKIDRMRGQIIYASGKLNDLQEQFSSRSNYRIKIKRLLSLALKNAELRDDEVVFTNGYPQKELVREDPRFLYPGLYDFAIPQYNEVIHISRDKEYEDKEKQLILKDIRRQQVINQWVKKGKHRLAQQDGVWLGPLIEEIMIEEKDFAIAHQVAIELTQFVSEEQNYRLNIEQQPELLTHSNVVVWKMELRKFIPTSSSKKRQ